MKQTNPQHGARRDVNDQRSLRHARQRTVGFHVGSYLQPPPMLFTRDGHNVFLGDMYRGRYAFLICSGPSLTDHDLKKLETRGVLTCSVNNAATVVRTHLWCSVDSPTHFHDAIWRDPAVLKFVPLCHMEKHFAVRDSNGQLQDSPEKVGDMPAVFGFRRNEEFQPEQWLFEDTFNWGNHSKSVDSLGQKGSRSVMYIALRLLFYLGIRRVYLLGCDFKMELGQQNYAFPQERSESSVRGNNSSYRILNKRLEALLPYFKEANFSVFNCTPDSGLTAFPLLSFEEALTEVESQMPKNLNTSGMYDGQAWANGDGHRKNGRAVQRMPDLLPASRPEGIPETSIALNLGVNDINEFEQNADEWLDNFPWLSRCNWILRANRHVLKRTKSIQALRRIKEVTYVKSRRLNSAVATIKQLAQQVTTPWFLVLDARARAHPKGANWPNADWFLPSGNEQKHAVLVGHRWGYAKPPEILHHFEDWAEAIGLTRSQRDSLAQQYPPDGNRVKFPTISEWFCWCNTEWLKEINQTIQTRDVPPPKDIHPVLLLHLIATYQNLPTCRVDMKACGWEHHFRR